MVSAIETIAVLFAGLGIVKLIVVMINKNVWIEKVSLPVYNSKLSGFIMAGLAILVFYFLIQVFSIVQIFAVMAFSSLLIGVAFMSFSKEFVSVIKTAGKKKLSLWMRIYSAIWLVLSLWVLYEVFIG